MRRQRALIAAFCFLSCSAASAKDFYITVFEGDYDAVYAIAPTSIVDLDGGVKRADLIHVGLDAIEVEEGVSVTTGSLDVMVIEVNCGATPRQFKEDSEYVQFFRTSEKIDKTSINPYKDWTPLPKGSNLEVDADFVCNWPKLDDPAATVKLPAADEWAFVDSVVDTVTRIRAKK
jgi:hypothetical protein